MKTTNHNRHSKAIQKYNDINIRSLKWAEVESELGNFLGCGLKEIELSTNCKEMHYDINNTKKCVGTRFEEQMNNIICYIKKNGCQRVVVFDLHFGFGHAMTAPHIAKYLFGDDNTILIFCNTKDRHNEKLGSAYPNTKIFYISTGEPGWNISLSAHVIIPAIIISYIKNKTDQKLDVLLGEDMYDMLGGIAKDLDLDLGRATAAAEEAVFMAQTSRESFDIGKEIFGLSPNIADNFSFEDSVCIYIRLKKAGKNRSCPSLAALQTTLTHCAKLFKHVYVTGDITKQYELDNLGIKYLSNDPINDELKLIIPVLSQYNITLGFGGGSHIPITYGKSTLCICNHWGFIFPRSLYLTSRMKDERINPNIKMIENYVYMTSTLNPKELNNIVDSGNIIPPTRDQIISAIDEYKDKKDFGEKGYIFGKYFEDIVDCHPTNLFARSGK